MPNRQGQNKLSITVKQFQNSKGNDFNQKIQIWN